MSIKSIYGPLLVAIMQDRQPHTKQELLERIGGPDSRLWGATEWAREHGAYIYCVDKATHSYQWVDSLPEIRYQNGRLRNQEKSRVSALAVVSRERAWLEALAVALGKTPEMLKAEGRADEARRPPVITKDERAIQELHVLQAQIVERQSADRQVERDRLKALHNDVKIQKLQHQIDRLSSVA